MYTFIKFNGGWWRKISSVDEYVKADLFNNEKWNNGIEQLVSIDQDSNHYTNDVALYLSLKLHNNKSGILSGVPDIVSQITCNQLKALEKYGAIYVNRNGGYCFHIPEDEKIKKESPEFPDDEYKKVEIKKWPYGAHYYVYINGKQISEQFGNIKWNTIERAREVANQYA